LPSPILARADALMQRKRQSGGEFDDLPILTDAISDDDIPLLVDAEPLAVIDETEPEAFVAPESFAAGTETPVTQLAATGDSALREQLVRELARRVEQRLSAELPRLIESTVCDFLAEQEMIARLPPHD
jgi:hypothetical protein